ncbi:FxsA family protein [Corynebacterium suicordis]|uniref:FxsA family protein n=1 Tax=uncultured Corynebacterium sp. TaxID=159447 RepID=UPI00259306F4|nr:FxsA family protein [uncultured Corynebacterium sp.]
MPLLAAAYLIIEITAFILLGLWIGFGWAILLIIGLFVLGLALSAWQFRELTRRVSTTATHPDSATAAQPVDGESPGRLTADLALALVGSLLVAVPGVVTSALGIFFLLPPTRTLIRKGIGAGARVAITKFADNTYQNVYGVARPGSKAYGKERADRPQGWGEVIDHRAGETPTNSDPRTGNHPEDPNPPRGIEDSR